MKSYFISSSRNTSPSKVFNFIRSSFIGQFLKKFAYFPPSPSIRLLLLYLHFSGKLTARVKEGIKQ